jgi:hypothetical protein
MYPSNYSYYPGYGGIPGQPGAAPATPEGNGAGVWDPNAAGAAYYQQSGTWGGFYNGEWL